MAPPVSSTWNVIHCPPLIAALCTAPASVDAGPRRQRTLMDEPTLEHQQSVHYLTVHADFPRRNATLPRAAGNRRSEALRSTFECVPPGLRRAAGCRSNYRSRPQPGTGKFKNSTRTAHRYAGPRRHHSSDVPGVVGRLAASRRMSRSIVSSPTLRLSRFFLRAALRRLSGDHQVRFPPRAGSDRAIRPPRPPSAHGAVRPQRPSSHS